MKDYVMPAFVRAVAALAVLSGCATASRQNQQVVADYTVPGNALELASCVYERAEAEYGVAPVRFVPLAGRYLVDFASAGLTPISMWSAEYSDAGGGNVRVVARAFPNLQGAPLYGWKEGATMTNACAWAALDGKR